MRFTAAAAAAAAALCLSTANAGPSDGHHGHGHNCGRGRLSITSLESKRAKREDNGRLELTFRAVCVQDDGDTWVNLDEEGFGDACWGPDSGYDLLDGNQPVSYNEAKWCVRRQYNPEKVTILVLVLIDTSHSVADQPARLESIKTSVQGFVSSLLSQRANVRIDVRIDAFDGRKGTQRVSKSGEDGWGMGDVDGLRCDKKEYCNDPSTNLHGAIKAASGIIGEEVKRRIGSVTSAFLVFFTDGTDQARITSAKDAIDELKSTEKELNDARAQFEIHGIGVLGETRGAGDTAAGIDKQAIQRLTLQGDMRNVHQASSYEGIRKMFAEVEEKIHQEGRRYFKLVYCTPVRAGTSKVSLQLPIAHEGHRDEYELGEYNAGELGAGVDNVGTCNDITTTYCLCTQAPTSYPTTFPTTFPTAAPRFPTAAPITCPGRCLRPDQCCPGDAVRSVVPPSTPTPTAHVPTRTSRASADAADTANGSMCSGVRDSRDNWRIIAICFIVLTSGLLGIVIALMLRNRNDAPGTFQVPQVKKETAATKDSMGCHDTRVDAYGKAHDPRDGTVYNPADRKVYTQEQWQRQPTRVYTSNTAQLARDISELTQTAAPNHAAQSRQSGSSAHGSDDPMFAPAAQRWSEPLLPEQQRSFSDYKPTLIAQQQEGGTSGRGRRSGHQPTVQAP